MALIPILPEDFKVSSVRVHPTQHFKSSSSGGIVGDVFLFAERSNTLKNITNDLTEYRNDILSLVSPTPAGAVAVKGVMPGSERFNISSFISNYLDSVNSLAGSLDNQKKLIVYRFDMPHEFNQNTVRKSIFINNLLPFYQMQYDNPLNFGFTNYHSLNFFTSSAAYPSGVPSDSALVFPNPISRRVPSRYYPSASFSFEFYINPRYTTDTSADTYGAGTILHLPNAYCVSMISGSGKDSLGRPNTFRLLFQLGNNAQVLPSSIKPDTSEATGSQDQRIFISSDSFLKRDIWSHCAIRWGGKNQNNYTGSFYIDGQNAGEFVIEDTLALSSSFSNVNDIPTGLVVGNRYEASNDTVNNTADDLDLSGDNRAIKISYLFDSLQAKNFGVEEVLTGSQSSNVVHDFNCPLNAEVQELKIFSRFRTDTEINASAKIGYQNYSDSDFLFYLPPAFVPSSSQRLVLKTPSQSVLSSSHTPFNLDLSFGLGGRSINLENFAYDFVNKTQARCFMLEETAAAGSITDFDSEDFFNVSATDALYLRPQNRKRNLTILPSDNGDLYPQFSRLDRRIKLIANIKDDNIPRSMLDDSGNTKLGHVNMQDMISFSQTHEVLHFKDQNPDSIANALLPDPNVIGIIDTATGNPVTLQYNDVYGAGSGSQIDLTVLNRTQDANSNEITFLDISNMFYGDSINGESFYLRDIFVTGSAGKISLTFRDNGYGSLYRCDATGSHPTWSSVGHLLYEEGLACLVDPTIPPFGKISFETWFQGDRNVHVMEMRVPISADEAVSSSNPTFQDLSPTNLPADEGMGCNLITNMFIHDENLNVIGKVNLARPIVRKDNDKYVFKFKMDF